MIPNKNCESMKVILLVFGLFGFFSLQAQCIKGDCFTGHGTYVFEDGSRYIGNFKRGVIEGKGIFYYPNGDKYLGDWKDNKKHGKGKLIYRSGESYIGHFARDKFHGQGKFTTIDGQTTEGQWANNHLVQSDERKLAAVENEPIVTGMRPPTRKKTHKNCNKRRCHNEKGFFVYSDGSRFDGFFKNGQPSGHGKVTYASGDKYVGEWQNHAPHGEGVMYFTSGRVYGAQWNMGKPIRELEPEQATDMLQDIMVEHTEERKVWAVVIGVSRYKHMPVLNYSDDDAYRFYAFLKSPEGGALQDEQIALLIDEDANRKDILNRMQQTVFKADENDIVLVYFSGHGLQGSFLPIDFDGYNNKLAYKDITHILSKSKAEYKMCFADACHSGSLMASKGINETIDHYYNAFQKIEGGTAFMLSSKAEEFSLEDGGLRQGVFSHFLIKGIKGAADRDRNKIVTIGELYEYVRFEVRKYSGNVQTPVMIGQYDKNMPVGSVRQ